MTHELIDWNRLADIEDAYHQLRERFPSLTPRYVAGQGDNPYAMLIGEAPGAQEDLELTPFVGPAGMVLRQLMAHAGLYATRFGPIGDSIQPNCWLTNVIKFRPPGNRKPTTAEIKAARPLLRAEWDAIGRPRVVIMLGGTATEAVLGKPRSILNIAGAEITRISRTDGLPMHVWPMLHPSFGLRHKPAQAVIERDWDIFAAWFREYPF